MRIDCGICAVACPEDAISYGSFVDDPTRVRAVVDGALFACASCGAATAAGLGHPTCTWCPHGAGEVARQHDGAGLVDDLGSQIEYHRGRWHSGALARIRLSRRHLLKTVYSSK